MDEKTAITIINFFSEYSDHYDELRAFLALKLERVVADDLVWLTNSLTEEQKLVMRSNALETRRISMFSEMGLENYTSSRLMELFPVEFKGRLRVSLESIANSADYIKETNELILELIEKKLSVQAELLNKSLIAGSDTYTAKGEKIHKSPPIIGDDFIKKV